MIDDKWKSDVRTTNCDLSFFIGHLSLFAKSFSAYSAWERTHPACRVLDTLGTLEACAPRTEPPRSLRLCGEAFWLRLGCTAHQRLCGSSLDCEIVLAHLCQDPLNTTRLCYNWSLFRRRLSGYAGHDAPQEAAESGSVVGHFEPGLGHVALFRSRTEHGDFGLRHQR